MKVLISAYACSPYKGSEPAVGWGFVIALSRLHDLCVITEISFKKDIERYFSENPNISPSIRFEYVQRTRYPLVEKLFPPAYYWTYRRWHQDAFILATKLHQEIGFDVAHQLTMVGFREPGYLWQLGIPFVWGPVGGMGFFPWRFLPAVGIDGALYYLFYNILNWLHMHYLSRPRYAATTAGDGLLAMNEENAKGLRDLYAMPSEVCIPVGPPSLVVDGIISRLNGNPLRIIWSGLHNPGKALNIALKAMSKLPSAIDWELHILGEGKRTSEWKMLAASLGIDARCHFYGWMPREQSLNLMKEGHLMLLTSLREGTPTVITEAFSLGLPVLCLDCSGMVDMVDETCGIKVPVTTPAEVIGGLAGAVELLARDEPLRQRLARGALARAKEFAWEDKAHVVDRIYRAKAGRVLAANAGAGHEE